MPVRHSRLVADIGGGPPAADRTNLPAKRRYLAVYDYGPGGVWLYIWAKSADDIFQSFPELEVVEPEPEHWTDEDRRRTEEKCTYDLEQDSDKGLLAKIKRARAT